jgi:hypothetical protein
VSVSTPSERRLRGVLEVAQGVLCELDLDAVLERVVEAAREVSGASYAALGVLDRSRTSLSGSSRSGSTRRREAGSASCRAAAGCWAS